MGATIKGDTIYITKDLDKLLTQRERWVIWAHEIGHKVGRHKELMMLILIFCPIISWVFHKAIHRYFEIEADKYALNKTKDPISFISVMDKLEHSNNTYPPKEYRVGLAKMFIVKGYV